jgi:hypothetical protein
MGLACISDGDTKHVYMRSGGSPLHNSHFEDQEHDCTRSGSQITGDYAEGGNACGDGVGLTDAATICVAIMRL